MAKKNKSTITISDELKSDLKKYILNFCIGMGTYVRDDLVKHSEIAIHKFYLDYEPTVYQRHYTNLSRSYRGFYENKSSKQYNKPVYGGVILSHEKMRNLYQDTTEVVFDAVYTGYHGFKPNSISENDKPSTSSKVIPPMDPSPMEIIKMRRQYIVQEIKEGNNSLLQNGYLKCKNDTYSTLIVK